MNDIETIHPKGKPCLGQYSQTCIKRPPRGFLEKWSHNTGGRLTQFWFVKALVTSKADNPLHQIAAIEHASPKIQHNSKSFPLQAIKGALQTIFKNSLANHVISGQI